MTSWDVHFDLAVDLNSPRMVTLIERAHALAAVIQGIPIPPHLQRELDALNVMRAVRGTTAIEGAQVSVTEVQQIMESPQRMTLPQARHRDEQEVRNAQEVMFYIANLLGREPDHPVTEALICRLHELITKNIDYEKNIPGEYRSHSVNAGDYQPPMTGDEVRRLMMEFVEWFRSPPASNWDPIVRALAAHFYVISIHPFGDGNGRTSRALESFLLYQGHVNARGFYSLANYYYQNRTDYVWHLDNARFNSGNNLTPFVGFGLVGLVAELKDVHAQVINEVKLISFRDYAREMFLHEGKLGTKAGERLFHFLIALGHSPMPLAEIRARKAGPASLYRRVSIRTLERDLAFLKAEGLIVIDEGTVVPNLELMEQYTALAELQKERGLSTDAPKPS
jgi:Fic family protein